MIPRGFVTQRFPGAREVIEVPALCGQADLAVHERLKPHATRFPDRRQTLPLFPGATIISGRIAHAVLE